MEISGNVKDEHGSEKIPKERVDVVVPKDLLEERELVHKTFLDKR